MMRDFRNAGLILALFTAFLSFPVMAADIEAEVEADFAPQLEAIEVETGWYLRGDVGYNADMRAGGSSYRTFDTGLYTAHNSADELSRKLTFDLGVGYSFTDMFRADVTLGRISSAFEGTGSCDPSLPSNCSRYSSSDFTGYSALANAYVDLGTVIGFTPYVGAGIGYTYLSWDDFESRNLCGGVACAGNAGTSHPGESDWRFTYALMAGVAYDISPRMKLDLSYRYTNVDGGNMHGWDAASAAAGATGIQAADDGFSTHEVRVGLRFALW